jgi:dTDP-4-dehydro-6-deoxy-alpha-D-glucopyranose 2,3-dehydratase
MNQIVQTEVIDQTERCTTVAATKAWLQRYRAALTFDESTIDFADSDQWLWDEHKAVLSHRNGKFYSIVGFGKDRESRPLIDQPEVGTQGFVVCEFDGELQILAQARTEPGNLHVVELGPTIQATWSNYSRAHAGRKTLLLDLFHEHDRDDVTVLADVVLPELGSFFFRKYNRNILISVASPEGFASERFRWIPLSTMIELFQHDHVINNDARLVFGLLIKTMVQSQLVVRSSARTDLLNALRKKQRQWKDDVERIPLDQLTHWTIGDREITPCDDAGYKVIQLRVRASDREVTRWDQPMIQTLNTGLVLLMIRRVDHRYEVCLEFKFDLGNEKGVLLGPSLTLSNVACLDRHPEIHAACTDQSAMPVASHRCSEEGGRFYRSINEYRVVDVSNVDTAAMNEPLSNSHTWVDLDVAIDLYDANHVMSDDCRGVLSVLFANIDVMGRR